MKPSLHTLAFSIVAAWLCPLAATSEIVTFNFTGTVRYVYNPHGVVSPTLIRVGDPVQLSLRFDTTTPDGYPSDPMRGKFLSPGWLKVSVNGLAFERTTTNQIAILHGANGGQEYFEVIASGGMTAWPASIPTYPIQKILMQAWETGPPYDFLSSAELPTGLDFSRANTKIGTVRTGTSSENMYEFQFDYVQVPAPPHLVCLPSITVSNNAGQCSAMVTAAQVDNGSYDPQAAPLTFSLEPPPPYSVGSHTVTFTATATNGLSTSTNVVVQVVDTDPPIIVCASNKLAECGTAWDFDPAFAFDNCSATNVSVSVVSTVTNASCDVTFTATRTWVAVDGATNTATCSQTVMVADTMPPTIVCPAPVTVEFQNENGAVVSYAVTASDTCSPASVVVTPVSGSLFPIGVSAVRATAMDACSNASQCTFSVTVLGAQGVQSNVLTELIALRASVGLDSPCGLKLDDAILHLQNTLNPAYWIDQTHLQPKGGNMALNEEKLAANMLRVVMDSKNCPVDPTVLEGLINRILKSSRLLATLSIEEAAVAGLNAKKISEDLAMVSKGDEETAAGHYANAVEHYRNAWRHAIQLRLQVSLAADGSAHLQFVGNTSKSFLIEGSTDMVNWSPLVTCTPDAEGNVEFTDSDAASSFKFYRVVER